MVSASHNIKVGDGQGDAPNSIQNPTGAAAAAAAAYRGLALFSAMTSLTPQFPSLFSVDPFIFINRFLQTFTIIINGKKKKKMSSGFFRRKQATPQVLVPSRSF